MCNGNTKNKDGTWTPNIASTSLECKNPDGTELKVNPAPSVFWEK